MEGMYERAKIKEKKEKESNQIGTNHQSIRSFFPFSPCNNKKRKTIFMHQPFPEHQPQHRRITSPSTRRKQLRTRSRRLHTLDQPLFPLTGDPTPLFQSTGSLHLDFRLLVSFPRRVPGKILACGRRLRLIGGIRGGCRLERGGIV